jgi:hypothetical protein
MTNPYLGVATWVFICTFVNSFIFSIYKKEFAFCMAGEFDVIVFGVLG